MSRKLILKNVRFSYVRVFEAEQFNGVGDFHYSVVLLIPKTDTALVKQINDAVKAEAQEYFAKDPKEFDPRKYLGAARSELVSLIKHKNESVLGSAGKA